MIVGNPFPVIEHPFKAKNYNGKPINPGYQSHFTLGILFTYFLVFIFTKIKNKIVNGNSTSTAYPITKIEQLNEEWTDELVVHESQTYPSYIVYTS